MNNVFELKFYMRLFQLNVFFMKNLPNKVKYNNIV